MSSICTSLIPTDSGSGYRHSKARLGRKHVRPWKWMPFTIQPEKMSVLYHWRWTTEKGKDYPFVHFNKKLPIPTYTDEECTIHNEY
ncbi:PREDICTED: DNA methyltransferase 1-associated protein 1-like [Amphimedon queenslandica]|uniref:Uncharacterized protein n=1 Tax=Amphimedon queenslandica TaxID=400682 RepID=A0AAN0JN39_AMPQE|nr:PREDICTED: DNA methyltransferase 1-associated protein 1-like [Amphimedon queenslandica]|eukprot:XP_019858428.1 PREDICTED: DNA methyltransferase 1-associated protein 1-like [Amphimedon queenslandica]